MGRFVIDVAHVMSSPAVTIDSQVCVADAEWIAEDAHVHHLLVVDQGRLVGVVCSHDLHDAAAETPIAACMSSPPICMGPLARLSSAADAMRQHQISCLPIVDHGHVLGVVTRGDLISAGVPIEDLHGEVCAACGARRHVRIDPRTAGVAFCIDCLERSNADCDVGGGD
jgi:acetoin utilization protein AcuB